MRCKQEGHHAQRSFAYAAPLLGGQKRRGTDLARAHRAAAADSSNTEVARQLAFRFPPPGVATALPG